MVGIFQRRGHRFGMGLDHLAVDGFAGGGLAAPAAEDHRDERTVHAATHDVGQDRARGADQRAGHDQQIVAQRKANRRRGPARVGIQHRDHDRHVGAADGQDQVAADQSGDDRDRNHRPQPGAVQVQVAEHEAGNKREQVQQVTTRQRQCCRAELSGQLAVGDDRAGEGDRADQDAEEEFDFQDAQLDRRLLRDGGGEAGQFRNRSGLLRGQRSNHFEVRVDADENGGQPHQAVEAGDQFRHLRHLHAFGHDPADDAATDDHRGDQPVLADARRADGGGDCQRHADDAVPDGALGFFLIG